MDLGRLRYLCHVARSGSMRGAAKSLEISPSVLSRAVKLLEEELGFALIVDSGRGIALTDEGKLLVQKSEAIIREVDELRDIVKYRITEAKPLKIGTLEIFSTYFLQSLLIKSFQDIPLVIHHALPGQLEQALVDGRMDLGVTLHPIPYPDLDQIKVATLKMAIFGRRQRFSGLKFSELPFAVPVKPLHGTPTRASGLDGWPDERMVRNSRYQVDSVQSAIQLAEMGLAVAYLPKFLVRHHNRQARSEFALEEIGAPSGIALPPQQVYLLKRKSYVETGIVSHLARVIRESAQE